MTRGKSFASPRSSAHLGDHGSKGPVVLADRDGTLIREVPYLSRLEDIDLLPGVLQALKRLNERGIPVAIVTNQSGVARGYFPESFVLESHAVLMNLLREGGASVQGLYYCPHLAPTTQETNAAHSPYFRDCSCRKPAPGLLTRALHDLSGDPKQSVMIGDADRDMAAAFSAGCRHGYLITAAEADRPIASERPQDLSFVRSFEEAVHLFLLGIEQNPDR